MLTLPTVQENPTLNALPVFYWNHVGLEMNRLTHSLAGPHGGPTMSSRALGLLHLAMHDGFLAALGATETSSPPTYLPNKSRAALTNAASSYEHSGKVSVMEPKPSGAAERSTALDNANRALTGAAITILDLLYSGAHPDISIVASDTLTRTLSRMIADYREQIDILHPAHVLGEGIAKTIFQLLAVKPGEPGADAGRYEPKSGPYYFRDEPVTPVHQRFLDPNNPDRGTAAVQAYHGPSYGFTVRDFGVTQPKEHRIADHPKDNPDYINALKEVVALGGAPNLRCTTRKADETAIGYYWAYDGANLIGTPPRLYNQIARLVAFSKRNAKDDDLTFSTEVVRVLALVNTAMADAGKFAWHEKYRFELWRPLSGVREHPDKPNAAPAYADPFWLALGAPETNSDRVAFKPPFPAYPSGHATFGAAAFQMLRLYYGQRDGSLTIQQVEQKVQADGFQKAFGTAGSETTADGLEFTFTSDELDGVSRDLRQPYDPDRPIEDQQGTVRTKAPRTYPSLWHAIFDNAFSRIYLGVHWNFDAAAASDIYVDGDISKGLTPNRHDIVYRHVWPRKLDPSKLPTGGVPLGLGIANDIFLNQMRVPRETGEHLTTTTASTSFQSKRSNTTYRAL